MTRRPTHTVSTTSDPASLDQLATAGAAAADSIDQAFARAGESLAHSLAKAAETGKLSFADLARSILDTVDRLAGVGASSPTAAGTALFKAIGQILLSGDGAASATTPATTSGAASAAPATIVNLTVQGASDPQAFVRSEAQIAQALTRAASFGA